MRVHEISIRAGGSRSPFVNSIAVDIVPSPMVDSVPIDEMIVDRSGT